jgi:hypothetical protein
VLAVITGFLDLIPQVGATIAAVILRRGDQDVLREAGAPRRARMAAMRDR